MLSTLRAHVGDVYVFGDEAGDLVFKRGTGVSRYFILGTVTMRDCAIGMELLDLRRDLALRGHFMLSEFHAKNDKPRVRELVFDVLSRSDIRVDVTILDKTKTMDHLRVEPLRFYKEAWYLHLKYVAPRIATAHDAILVVASSLQIKKKRRAIHDAVIDVVDQVSPSVFSETAFWPAASDPCLQVADYAVWAIQRRYESGDDRFYRLIGPRIQSEFEPFKVGRITYY